HCLREDLNKKALRVMAVLRPLKVIIDNYPEGQVEELEAINNPEDPDGGTRKVPFSKVIYIEQDDFREDPPKKYFRLSPGTEVRLKHAYYITCERVVKNEKGEIVEVHCKYDPESRGGGTPDGRKVKGTLHWVSAEHGVNAEVRLYDYLFNKPDPEEDEGVDFIENLRPNSLEVLKDCKIEPGLKDAKSGTPYQFIRQGYFCVDAVDSKPDAPVFNRTISLVDTWAKIEKKM
ncbi:MAG: glutamine--tRNA ligase, partial [Nitrospirota bacterium]